MADRPRHIGRKILMAIAVLAVIAVVAYGWMYSRDVDLVEVRYSGIVLADSASIAQRAAVPDSVKIFALDLSEIADRVAAEPWVKDVTVNRNVRGILTIDVEEHTPVAMALSPEGRPLAFLEENGGILPLSPSALRQGYNVPLLTGTLPTLVPGDTLTNGTLLELLGALSRLDPLEDALISGIERHRDGRLTLHTAPNLHGKSLPVALGRNDFSRKFRHLAAFWEQAVLTDTYSSINSIDLRHRGIVVATGGN